MKKILSAILVFFLFLFSLSAETSSSKQVLNVGLLNGPSSIPAAYLIEKSESAEKPELGFLIFSGVDLEVPKLLKGEIDIGILPPNAAANLYQKTNGNIVVLAVIGEGNLSLLTTDPDYKDLSSLKGKTIHCAGRGATPEYIFRYVLENNLKDEADSVELDFSIPNPELASSLLSGKSQYILVPEPFATVALLKGKDCGVRKVFDPSEESEFRNQNFPMTVLVCSKNTYNLKKAEIKAYLKKYRTAVEWTNRNPSDAGVLVEKYTLGLNAQVSAASIPNGRYVFVPAKKARPIMERLFQIFLNQNPDSIGGKLPAEDFYQFTE